MTLSTTKAAFIKSVLAEMNARRLNKMSGYDRLAHVLVRIQRVVEYEVVTRHQAMVAYAVEWSVSSLRLNQAPEQALLAMDTRQLISLVYDLAKTCPTQISVTYRLNEMYKPAPVDTQEAAQEQPETTGTKNLTPAQTRVMDRLNAGDTLCTVEKAGKVVEARLYNEQTGESSVSKVVASALLAKKQVKRYCWYTCADGEHIEYVAA